MTNVSDLTGLGMSPELAGVITKKTVVIPSGLGNVGATAGWATNNNTGNARLPASQTASTLCIPVPHLEVGSIVKSFKVNAQIESAGNTATLDASLRRLTAVAADPADASLGAITQVSATADTLVASSHTLATREVVVSGESLYVLVTGTTAASTDIQLVSVEVEVEQVG